MDNELFGLLSAEKQKQDKACAYFGDRYIRYYTTERREITNNPTANEIRFVLVREDGSYITPRTMQHTSHTIHHNLNIKDFDYHSLRHTHATVLLEKGAPLKYIQQRLGHKKIDVTVNVYQHLTDDLRKQGTDILNGIFEESFTA